MSEPLSETVGCCDRCKGTGFDGTPETNGMCSDCRATGCAHPEPLCRNVTPVEPTDQSDVDPRLDAFDAGWNAGYDRGGCDADVGSAEAPDYDEALAAFLAEQQRQRPVQQQPTYDLASGRWSDGWGEPEPSKPVGWLTFERAPSPSPLRTGATATVRSLSVFEVVLTEHPVTGDCQALTRDRPFCRACGAGLVAVRSDGKVEPL